MSKNLKYGSTVKPTVNRKHRLSVLLFTMLLEFVINNKRKHKLKSMPTKFAHIFNYNVFLSLNVRLSTDCNRQIYFIGKCAVRPDNNYGLRQTTMVEEPLSGQKLQMTLKRRRYPQRKNTYSG